MLALHLPAFRLERCGHDTAGAVVLVEFARSADRVLACTPLVARAGVVPGMALAEARALCPELRVERREGEGERGDLESLRDMLLRFSPAVAAVFPDGLLVDVPPAEIAPVVAWLSRLGHAVEAAWAPDPWAAILLSRAAPHASTGVDRGPRGAAAPQVAATPAEAALALAPLPVGMLGLSPEVLESMADAGVRSIGQFARLPLAALAGRYGAEVVRLHGIARGAPGVRSALGQRVLASLERAEAASSRADEPVYDCDLDDEIDDLNAILFVVHGLCRDCEVDLERAGLAAARVLLRLRLTEGEHLVPVRLGQPVRGADRMFRQLRARLERVTVGAPVTAVSLTLLESCPWRPPQAGLFERADAAEPLPELLARLQDALGTESVFRPAEVDTWRPEASWVPVLPGKEAPRPVPPRKADPALVHEPDAARWTAQYEGGKVPRAVPLPASRPRPAVILPSPRPVRVAVGPSGRPRALMLDRDTVAIADLEGPERVQGEWWKDRAAYARDYWIAQLADGRRAWLYSEQFSSAQVPRAGAASSSTTGFTTGSTLVSKPGGAPGASRPALARRWFLHGWIEVATSVNPSANPIVNGQEPEPQAAVLRFPGSRLPGPRHPVAAQLAPELSRAPRVVPRAGACSGPRYAELLCRSNYSFSEGASAPDELVERAAELGLSALAITDRDGLYGAVRAHRAAKSSPVPLIHGALLSVENGASLVALVQNIEGWSSLCRLLSAERLPAGQSSLDAFSIGIPGDPRHADPLVPDAATLAAGQHMGKGWPRLSINALLADNAGLVFLARGNWSVSALEPLRDAVGDRLYRAVSRRLDPGEDARIHALVAQDIPCVAVGDVLYHDRARQPLQDILACIRLGLTLDQAGRRLQPNAERALHGPAEMARRFARWPELVDRTIEIADRCQFSLKELTYQYPREVVPSGYSAQAWLRELVRRGLMTRYGAVVPEKVARQVEYELGVVERLGFSAYFLTVNDLVRFARSRGILCQGRGSAANSAVCFALGITSVDPAHSSLLFERFISEERGEPPDIDVDFEHERREEVIQYCYQKYGRDRAAMVNEIISYRGRSAVRDVGKACGLGLDQVDRLCGLLDSWGKLAEGDEVLKEAGLDPTDGRVSLAMRLGREIQGFPRHTSIHVGGFVISDGPLVDRAPVEPATMAGRTVIQWDKDDVDELGFVKVDCLALGMLTAIRRCFDLVRASTGQHYDLGTVPREDPAVYAMLGEADSIGVFQVESRAQQGMLPRLKPKNFYDLVIEVSVVRPGPIQGGMVHPYLRRRQGLEEVEYADPRLIPILERTLGVPIFQEQVMAMAVAVGGFTPGEADQLRRAMGAWRKRGGLGELTERLMKGLLSNGLQPEYAERVCKQIQGFAEYGFPESHAASFAHLVYVSAWQRCFFPAAFTAALINSQPMGFYAPRTLVADIERHGVEVRPVDVTVSDWDCTLEPGSDGPAIRLGLRLVKGLGETDGRLIVRARGERAFDSLPDLAVRTGIDRGGLDRGALRALARADALRWLPATSATAERPAEAQPRRAMAFAADGLWPGMFARLSRGADAELPEATVAEEMQADYATVGLKPGTHPVALARAELDRDQVVPLSRLYELPDGSPVVIAGLVGVRQRPDTASGVIFLMLEDETGTANVVVWPKLYKRQRTTIRTERLLRIRGVLQRMDGAISIVAKHVRPMKIGAEIVARSRDFH